MRAIGRLMTVAGTALLAAACEGSTGILTTSGVDGTTTLTGVVSLDGVGRGGITVLAIGTQRDSTFTDNSGIYRFRRLNDGDYSVTVKVPVGTQVTPGTQGTQTVTVNSNALVTANFSLQTTTPASAARSQ